MHLLTFNRISLRNISLILLVLCAVIANSSSAFCQEKAVIRIGALVSLSGGLTQYGDEIRKGYELAMEESSPVTVQLKLEDDKSVDKLTSVSAARKLIDIDKVDVLLNWSLASTPPLFSIANGARVPLVVGGYDETIKKAGPYVFGCQVNYLLLPQEIADVMVQRLGKRKIAIISVADYWSQSFPARFSQRVKELGGTVVLSESVDPATTDLKGIILRAQKLGAEGIFAPVYGNALFALVHQTKELHFAGIIHGADGIFEEDVRTLGTEAEGMYGSQAWVEDQGFAQRVQKKFGHSGSALQMGMIASAYDALVHIRGAAEEIVAKGESITKESLYAGIKNHKSTGIMVPIFLSAPPVTSGEKAVVVKNGKFVRLD